MALGERFGKHGGRFVPETLMPALEELEKAYAQYREDPAFEEELRVLLQDYAGRPTPLYAAPRLSDKVGASVYLKREDLAHTGAHKINNTLGQVLLAHRMGKERIIAETGAGQHGVATATVAALFGLKCTIYMGKEDMRRQELNVVRMRLLGAQVREVAAGRGTLKDATNEALRDWVGSVGDTHYVIGSVVGPSPYPRMVRDFQMVIGRELQAQMLEKEGRFPAAVVACVGAGSNAIGAFYPFLGNESVQLIGVEAGGRGLGSGMHGASLARGVPGVLHGSLSYVLQDEVGQIQEAHSISAGLDYPSVGPEHSYLKDRGRVQYTSVTDQEALAAFRLLAEWEGIIPALESAHALAFVLKGTAAGVTEIGDEPPGEDPSGVELPGEGPVVVNLSGRGDKDVYTAMQALEVSAK